MLSTLIPEWLEAQIKDQQKQRKDRFTNEEEKNFVNLDSTTLKDLEQSNFFSCKYCWMYNFAVKHGRGVHLLKAGALEKRQRKPSKQYPLRQKPQMETIMDPNQSWERPDVSMRDLQGSQQQFNFPKTPNNTKKKKDH